MKYRNRILFVLCGFLLTAANCYSQESTSKPEPNPASSPSASVQSGGAEIHDNVAFMPMELHDVPDSAGTSARQVNMGLVREEGEWKLLSLGVLLLDLPALETEWDEAEIEETEKSALESLKTIAS